MSHTATCNHLITDMLLNPATAAETLWGVSQQQSLSQSDRAAISWALEYFGGYQVVTEARYFVAYRDDTSSTTSGWQAAARMLAKDMGY